MSYILADRKRDWTDFSHVRSFGQRYQFYHNHYCSYLGLLIYSDTSMNANHPLNWFVEERCLIAFLIAQIYNFTPGG